MTERTREWPLVVFTTAVQCACGIALAAALLEWRTPSPRGPLALTALLVIAAGMLVSLFHLGRPLAAWRAATNLRRSRLSLEIVLAAAFGFALLVNAALSLHGNALLAPSAAVATLGLAAVVCSARIYVLRSQPVWNSTWVPVTFVATAVVVATLITHVVGEDGKVTALSTTFAAALLIISDLLMLRRLVQVRRRCDNEPPGLPRPLLSRLQATCLLLHLLLAGVFPVVIAFGSRLAISAAIALALLATGAACGRTLMYSLVARSDS